MTVDVRGLWPLTQGWVHFLHNLVVELELFLLLLLFVPLRGMRLELHAESVFRTSVLILLLLLLLLVQLLLILHLLHLLLLAVVVMHLLLMLGVLGLLLLVEGHLVLLLVLHGVGVDLGARGVGHHPRLVVPVRHLGLLLSLNLLLEGCYGRVDLFSAAAGRNGARARRGQRHVQARLDL